MVEKFIKKNRTLSDGQISDLLNEEFPNEEKKFNKDRVRYLRKKFNIGRDGKETVEEIADTDVVVHRLKKSKRETDKKYRVLIDRVDQAERERDVALDIIGTPIQTVKITASKKPEMSEATAFMVASDWHVEEEVDPETVLGKNSYNLEEAERRAKLFFVNGMRLLNIFQRDVHIEHLVIPLLGDFFSNNIHEELMEINQLSPSDAIQFVETLLVSGIEYVLKDKSIKKLTLVCHSGNHGRATQKKRHATQEGNSWEAYMYHHLEMYFKDNLRVNVHTTKSYYSILEVYDYKIRFHHGDNMRYGGGVGGLTIPVNKAIAQWDKLHQVDLDVFGHFHQFMDGGKFISNGSLIGYNAYAMSIKAGFEPPKQAMFLIDKKRFKTFVAPILFTE